MSEKNILLFYPHNFYEMTSGTHRRIYNLLLYLKQSGFSIDLVSLNGFTNNWNSNSIKKSSLLNSITVCSWSPSLFEKYDMWRCNKRNGLQNLAIETLRVSFEKKLEEKKYQFIIISYVYWAKLANIDSGNTVKIVDLHDFITLNRYLAHNTGRFGYGQMFEDEIEAISKFDYALSISDDETITLSPFCPSTIFKKVPVSFDKKKAGNKNYKYDLLFIGSENSFNIDGMNWFINKVYPLIPKTTKIAIVGKICNEIPDKSNFFKISYIENLDSIYNDTKLSICPLKGGTGLKIKLVEALSHAKPVITTSWGLSGIAQKENNGCILADSPEEFAKAISLLLNNDTEYEKEQKNAEHFFEKNFSTGVVHKNLDSVFMTSPYKRMPGPI